MVGPFREKIEAGFEQTYQDGDVIIREGDKGSEMYIIQSGTVKVTKKTEKGEITLATLSRGDFFGEMALFERARRSATVRAVGETRVIVLHAGNFLYRLRQDPTFVFEMIQKMCKRIRRLNEEIARISDSAKLDPQVPENISAETEFVE
jgi:CRP-like cAMP-binding protein